MSDGRIESSDMTGLVTVTFQEIARKIAGKMDRNRLSKAAVALVDLMERLRGPGGCPWDAQQDDSTIKMYMLEEAYEALEAIERSSPREVCQELGDLLFQIVFLARIAEERSEFDLVEVMEEVTEKMIRRHPHIFGEARLNSAAQVADKWAEIKKTEKSSTGNVSSQLNKVPVELPALLRSHRLNERLSKFGFDYTSPSGIWDKVQEDFRELEANISEEDSEGTGKAIGRLLFDLANLSRHCGQNAERLLRDANQGFLRRFDRMEESLNASNLKLEEATQEQISKAWEKAGGT